MNFVTINIAYIADNQDAVNELVSDLSSVNVNFNLIDAADFVNGEDFKDALTTENDPCFLMVSDNFLKSVACLQNGLSYLQILIKRDLVIPIIIDGIQIDDEGNRKLVATEFEKVSNVIKYMNYWQEKYLDLRKLKRSIPASDEEEFLLKLKVVRSISSEVGEFLRTLRDTNYYSFDDFSANNYEQFFRYFGDESDYLKFVAARSENVSPGFKKEIPTIKKEEPSPEQVVESKAAPAFLPFEDLLTEKNNIENIEEINASAKSDNDSQTEIEELIDSNISESNEIISSTETISQDLPEVTEIIEEPSKLIAMDPEWLLAGAEIGEDSADSEENREIPLTDLVQSEERDLTDTELLALELAEKIPNTVEEEVEIMEEDSEEEMISLEDLMGDDLLSATVISNVATTSNQIIAEKEDNSVPAEVDLFSQTVENSPSIIAEDVSEELEEEEEEELEGYFMDEGEETEDIEEELSEVEVLQSANMLVESGKLEESIDLLKETLKEAPEFVSVRYQYAAYLAKYQNNFKEASNQLATLLEQEPNNQSAMFFLGELAEAERDYLTAKSYYEKVYVENKEFPNVAYKLGMLLVNHLEESTSVAIEYFDLAYQQNPKNVNALYQLGLLKGEDSAQEEQATLALKEVLEQAPEHPFANYDLALIYHKRGDKATALNYYEQAAIVNPELKTAVNDQAFAIETATKMETAAIEENNLEVNALAGELEEVPTFPIVEEEPIIAEEEETVIVEESNIAIEKVYEIGTKIALVTGATSGIGKAIAIKLAQEGYSLILTGRRYSRLFQLKEQFETEYNAAVRLLPFDIQRADAVRTALAELEEDWQNVDVLVNNAGLAKGETAIHEGDLEHWETMIDTNIKGLLYVTREIAPFMVKRKKGQIINICSLGGKEVYPNNGVYCATKHAVDALTKAMRIDLHKYNIRVSQISPGFVEDTEFAAVKTGETNKTITDFMPVNATDVAEVIHFMVSRPNHVTLQEVVLTGTQQASANIIDRSGRKQ